MVNSGDNNFKKFESEADASQTLFSTAAATEGTAAGLYAAAEAAKASVVGSGAAAGLEAAAHAASAAAFAQNQTAQAKGQSAASTGSEALSNYGDATGTLISTESVNANPLTGLATEIASLSETVKKDNTALYSRVESKVGQLKNGKSSNNTSGFATSSIASNAANNNGNKKFGSLTTQSFNV